MTGPLLLATAIYGVIVVGGMTWLAWHANRRADRNRRHRQRVKDRVMIHLFMEGKRK